MERNYFSYLREQHTNLSNFIDPYVDKVAKINNYLLGLILLIVSVVLVSQAVAIEAKIIPKLTGGQSFLAHLLIECQFTNNLSMEITRENSASGLVFLIALYGLLLFISVYSVYFSFEFIRMVKKELKNSANPIPIYIWCVSIGGYKLGLFMLLMTFTIIPYPGHLWTLGLIAITFYLWFTKKGLDPYL